MKIIQETKEEYAGEQCDLYFFDELNNIVGVNNIIRTYIGKGYNIGSITINGYPGHSEPKIGGIYCNFEDYLLEEPLYANKEFKSAIINIEKEGQEFHLIINVNAKSLKIIPQKKKLDNLESVVSKSY